MVDSILNKDLVVEEYVIPKGHVKGLTQHFEKISTNFLIPAHNDESKSQSNIFEELNQENSLSQENLEFQMKKEHLDFPEIVTNGMVSEDTWTLLRSLEEDFLFISMNKPRIDSLLMSPKVPSTVQDEKYCATDTMTMSSISTEVQPQMDLTAETSFSNLLNQLSMNLSALKKIEDKVELPLNSFKNEQECALPLVETEFEGKNWRKELNPYASQRFEKKKVSEFFILDKSVCDSPATFANLKKDNAAQCQEN
ncbi:hypothetical protein HMI55_004458, partial [Coelomomyces lativittatus]